MTTMAEAVRSYVESVGSKVTSEQIKAAITAKHPNQWKPATLQAHLYACVVNNPKSYVHHPFAKRFLYRNADGTFELYSEERHGPNEWAPIEGDDEATGVGELVETSISLERDIEDHLVSNLEVIEKGLKLVGRQVKIDVGRIDILAEDETKARVVIEVKVGEAKDSAVGQGRDVERGESNRRLLELGRSRVEHTRGNQAVLTDRGYAAVGQRGD